MAKLQGLQSWWIVLALMFALAGKSYAQIRLPGGITINDPRQSSRRGSSAPVRQERPDPDRVCPKMVEWIQIFQREYPGVDLAHTPSNKLQQMAVPLFADDSFQKEFGMSYPSLSDTERRDFFRTHVIPCQTSRQYAQQTIVLQVFNPPFQAGTAGMGPLSPGQLIPALQRVEAARSTLHADEQALQTATPSADTYDQATGLLGKRKDELARVWPTEKAQFQSAVKDAVARSAGPAVDAKIQPLLTAPPSPQGASQLRDAPRTYAALFQAVPADQRTALETKLEDRRNAVLRQLLPPQQARAESFPATRQGLDDGAEWFASFQPVFLDPPVLPEAAAVAKAYLARREAVLARMAPQFRQKIETSQDPDAVASMFDDVFRLTDDRQTDTYRQLSTARVARAELLTKRAQQVQLAAEEKAEKAAILREEIVASSFKVANLTNAKVFRAIYVGDFAHAGIARADLFFVDMLGSYLDNFGETCKANLPADKVMMTVNECVQTQHWVNQWGVQTSPDSCIQWERHPTGTYADPAPLQPRSASKTLPRAMPCAVCCRCSPRRTRWGASQTRRVTWCRRR
jgi:hypothetical protein